MDTFAGSSIYVGVAWVVVGGITVVGSILGMLSLWELGRDASKRRPGH